MSEQHQCNCHPGNVCTSRASCEAARRVEFGGTQQAMTHKTVPVEPDRAQCAAMRKEAEFQFGIGISLDSLIHVYREAIKAAPPSPVTELEVMRKALSFYADPTRYHGPNQTLEEPDEWTDKAGLSVYRLDVTRDQGVIARTALVAYEAKKEGK